MLPACLSGFMTSTSNKITPHDNSGSSATTPAAGAGGRACPAVLKSKERKYVSPLFSSNAPGGQGNRAILAIILQTSSLPTMSGVAGVDFLAIAAIPMCTESVAPTPTGAPQAHTLYLLAGMEPGYRWL